jgi:hypothetical protein
MYPQPKAPQYVYFVRQISGEGPVKIGHTSLLEARLFALQTYAPYPLEIAAHLPGGSPLERRFHNLFRDQHSHREWFHPSSELDRIIALIRDGKFDISTLPAPRSLQVYPRGPRPKARNDGFAFHSEFAALRAELRKADIPEKAFLAEVKLHRTSWSRWETGEQGPNLSTWERVRGVAERMIAERQVAA